MEFQNELIGIQMIEKLFLGKRPKWRIVQIGPDSYITQSFIWFSYHKIGYSYSYGDLNREKQVVKELNEDYLKETKFKNKVIYL